MLDAIIFDIETGPLPVGTLADQMPEFTAPGNWKDEEKIAKNIAEQEAKWFEKAALKAETGEVLAIGFGGVSDGEAVSWIIDQHQKSEKELLVEFWDTVTQHRIKAWVGFNIFNFDLPFLLRRSLFHGVTPGVPVRSNRYWDSRFIDLMQLWQFGNREQTISLDRLAKYLGLEGKAGSGAQFAEWFNEDPAKASAYLKRDIELTQSVADRMIPWINAGNKESEVIA